MDELLGLRGSPKGAGSWCRGGEGAAGRRGRCWGCGGGTRALCWPGETGSAAPVPAPGESASGCWPCLQGHQRIGELDLIQISLVRLGILHGNPRASSRVGFCFVERKQRAASRGKREPRCSAAWQTGANAPRSLVTASSFVPPPRSR